jgi:uncharacterized protein YecE (DUF72 family)
MSELRIGTSGWSYPTGHGSWNGIFYPLPRPADPQRGWSRRSRLDELAYYAERFDTVEVNATFYRPPKPGVASTWVKRTPSNFIFSLKLYQKFTHPEMFRKAVGAAEVRVGQKDIDEFRRGIDPVASTGKLGALLAQFPPSFRESPGSREYLEALLSAFREYPTAVELRHRSWSDDPAATQTLLNRFGAAWVQIDEPKFRFSIRQNYLPNVTGFYYMRLHGRNAARWWQHERTEDRYDYLYSTDELTPFAETAGAARRLVKKLYLYMNNHFAAKAVANAVMLKDRLGLPVPGEYPEEFARRYPAVAGIVRTSPALSQLLF